MYAGKGRGEVVGVLFDNGGGLVHIFTFSLMY